MKHTELAYAAGYLDGEGCFSFHGGTPRVYIENTYIHTLQWFADRFGGKVRPKTKQENPNWRPAYCWDIYGDNARECINKVLPYLQEKHPQAAILLEISAYPPRSAMRTRLKEELGKLKRIAYEWTRLNTSQPHHCSKNSKSGSTIQSSSPPRE